MDGRGMLTAMRTDRSTANQLSPDVATPTPGATCDMPWSLTKGRSLHQMRRFVLAAIPQPWRRALVDRLPRRVRSRIRGPGEDDSLHPERLAVLEHLTGRCVEVGCGHRKTIEGAIGVDLTPARELGRVGNVAGKVSQADVTADGAQLPFRDRTFDSLVARHNLEHYIDTLAVLGEWRRVIRPGGRLVLVVPDEETFEGRTLDLDPTHYHGFSQTSLCRLIEASGMSIGLVRPVVPQWSFMVVAFRP